MSCIALLIPVTSRSRTLTNINQTDIVKHLLPTFGQTASTQNRYTIYVGYDTDDKYYTNLGVQSAIRQKFRQFRGKLLATIQFIANAPCRGHVTLVWNKLCAKAHADGADYMYQLGDDVKMLTQNWDVHCIKTLKANQNIGVTGPLDVNNHFILTQSFVPRNHYDIFGFYFPPAIKNWFCDDWITLVYKKYFRLFRINDKVKVKNSGGKPRYTVVNKKNVYLNQLNVQGPKLAAFIKSKGYAVKQQAVSDQRRKPKKKKVTLRRPVTKRIIPRK